MQPQKQHGQTLDGSSQRLRASQPDGQGSSMKAMAIIAVATLLVASCGILKHAPEISPLQTTTHVDLNRYLGLWYEIGRYPNSFQEGCLVSTALYTARPDGEIDVLNSCRDEQDGSLRAAKGRAWVVDRASNARLKVSFFLAVPGRLLDHRPGAGIRIRSRWNPQQEISLDT